MKAITLVAAAVAVLATSASAQTNPDEGRLAYSIPNTATVWKSGTVETIEFPEFCLDNAENRQRIAENGGLNIALYIGDPADSKKQTLVNGIPAIGKVDCLKNKSANVTVPANLPTSNLYSIHVSTLPNQSYSVHFKIEGVEPPKPSGPAVPSGPAPSASAPATATPSTPAAGANAGDTEKPPSSASSLKIATSLVAGLAFAVGSLMA